MAERLSGGDFAGDGRSLHGDRIRRDAAGDRHPGDGVLQIRYTEGWDFKRTERQRIVLGKLFEKAKAKGVTGLLPMVNTMMDYVSTSMSNTELLSLAAQIGRFHIQDTTGFPFNQMAADIAAGDCVVPVNLAANVSQLHAYLFGDEGYTPSQTVQEISDKIISDTGIQ